MERFDSFVHIFDELIHTKVVFFIVFDSLLLHVLVDLIQMLKISDHFAFIVCVIVVELYL